MFDHVVVTTMDARPEALYDFDGDGILDLVASNLELRSTFAEGSITVQPGRGDGSFAETTKIIPIGGSIRHLIVGDIDGSGHADIAFDEQVDHSIIGGLTIHFSDDSGQLRTEPRLFLNRISDGIATLPSPLNDGIDLLVADGRNRNLTAYRDLESDFSHPFADVVETHIIDNRASRHIFRDLNADGFTDVIAVGPRGNVLTIAHGHRLGFEEAARIPLRNEPYGFLFGNFQGDEGNELAIWTVNSVTIMDTHSLSTTSFTHEREVTLALADRWLRSVAVVDSNGDGRDEILFHRYIDFAGSQQEYAVLSNHGDNWTLDPWTPIVKTFENLAIYDVNADGFPDHLYTTDRELKVHLRDGDGNTTKVTTVPHVGNDFSKERIEVSDVNLDGNADVVLTNFRVGDQPVFLGDGLGGFVRDERVAVRPLILSVVVNTPLVSYAFPARSDELSNFVYRDIDKDGDVDLLISSTGGVTVFRGTGQGDFNRNGIIDSSDIQELRAADAGIASDLNDDNVINESDVRFLVEEIASTQLGDADLNGKVDFHDFLKLATNFGKTGTVWEQGDFNGDELTDFQDFLILAENFNAT